MKWEKREGEGREESSGALNERNKVCNTEWPKKCVHSLLINIFGINLNDISISG